MFDNISKLAELVLAKQGQLVWLSGVRDVPVPLGATFKLNWKLVQFGQFPDVSALNE
jgi:hypothetical protein